MLSKTHLTSQEYTELFKKDLQDPDNDDGVITDLEPDNLECEIKWALESITTNKASGGDGIPVELFQILPHRYFLLALPPQRTLKQGKEPWASQNRLKGKF